MRGNYILYALEAVLSSAAILTFTASGQEYLEILLLIVLVASVLHAVVAGITVCGAKKWVMIAINAIAPIIAIVMLILNLNTDKDNTTTPPTIAVGWQWKLALTVSTIILPLANVALVGDGSQWRCSQGLMCTNPGDLDAVKTSVRRYFNADRGESKPVSGPLAESVNINDFKDDQLDTTKIPFITVDANGKDGIDCKNFKSAVDRLTSQTLTTKKQAQIADRQQQTKLSYEAVKAQPGILGAPPVAGGIQYAEPGKQQYAYQKGGLFGLGAQKQTLAPAPATKTPPNPLAAQLQARLKPVNTKNMIATGNKPVFEQPQVGRVLQPPPPPPPNPLQPPRRLPTNDNDEF